MIWKLLTEITTGQSVLEALQEKTDWVCPRFSFGKDWDPTIDFPENGITPELIDTGGDDWPTSVWICTVPQDSQSSRPAKIWVWKEPALPAPNFQDRINAAIHLAVEYGGIDGDHHKAWVIDQMVRALSQHGYEYEQIVANARAGKDGPHTYDWNCGVAP